MSDDAFALSPLASRSPISDADYDVIHAAVMETARGRWFLSEYARRNRNADTQLLLRAIERIEGIIRRERTNPAFDRIQFDLHEMAKAIVRTKEEIAAIKPDPGGGGRIGEAAVELNAIVRATETATTRVLQAAERVQELAWTLRKAGVDARICDQLDAHATDIYIACEFQDITGQRTQKVVKVLHFLEERIDAMIGIWSGENPRPHDVDRATRQSATPMDQADVDAVMAPPGPAVASAPPVEPTASSACPSIPGELAEALNRPGPADGVTLEDAVAPADCAEISAGTGAGQDPGTVATAEAQVPDPQPPWQQDLSSQNEQPFAAEGAGTVESGLAVDAAAFEQTAAMAGDPAPAAFDAMSETTEQAPASPEIAADLTAATDAWISQASWAAMAQAWEQPDPVFAIEPSPTLATVQSAEADAPEPDPEVVAAAESLGPPAAASEAAAGSAWDEPASPIEFEVAAAADEPAGLEPEPAAVAGGALLPGDVGQAEASSAGADGPAVQQPATSGGAAAAPAIDALAGAQESRMDWAIERMAAVMPRPGNVATDGVGLEHDAAGASAAPEAGATAHAGGWADAAEAPIVAAVPADMPAADITSDADQPDAAALAAFEPEPSGQASAPTGIVLGTATGLVDAASAEFFNAEFWAVDVGVEEAPSESDADLLEPVSAFSAAGRVETPAQPQPGTALPDIGFSPPAEAAPVPPTRAVLAGMPHLFDQPGPVADPIGIVAVAGTGDASNPATAGAESAPDLPRTFGEDAQATPASPTLAAQDAPPAGAAILATSVDEAGDRQGADTADDDDLNALLFEPARPAVRDSQLMLVASNGTPASATGADTMQGLPGGVPPASEDEAVNGGARRADQAPAESTTPFPRPPATGRTLSSDPLAPLAAMSDEERIALFS